MASGNKVEIEVSANVTGKEAVDALGSALSNTGQDAKKLGSDAAGSAGGMGQADTAAKGLRASTDKLSSGMDSAGEHISKVKGELLTLAGIGFGIQGIKDIASLADEYKNLEARIKLVTGEGVAFDTAFKGVFDVALRTNSAVEETGTLFAKLAEAGKTLGVSQAEALKLTETINQSIQLSGASAEASKASIIQLVQGLQSGVLRGDEFNSVMEQSPRLAKALADGLGVGTGELRKMAEQGQLTSATVIKSLQGQSDAVASEFGKLPATVGRAIQNLSTSWTLYIGQADKASGASGTAASAINVVAQNLDKIARMAALAGLALTAGLAVQGAAAVRAYAKEAALAAGATNLLSASVSKIPKNVSIAVAVTGLEAGYELGTWLYNTSEYARKLGVAIVGYSQATINSLQFLKEAAAAVFTSDTIEAAVDRFNNRAKTMRESISAMWTDAEQAPAKVGSAVDEAATKTAQLGASAQLAGGQIAAAGVAGAAGIGQVGSASTGALGIFQKLLSEASKPIAKDGAIDGIVKSLKDAKAKGLDLNALLANELPAAIAKLSGPELAKFRQDFAKAMQEGGLRGKELQTGLRVIGEQAAKSLGVDVVSASNKVGQAFVDANENMRLLILSLPALKEAGVDTGQVVSKALSKMIDGAQNKAEIDGVIDRVNALRKQLGDKLADGLLDQAKQKAQELKKAMEDATPGIQNVAEAMRKLGITSDESLRNTAKVSKEAYDVMVQSGTASARELAAGFKKAADDAIAANKGIAPSWVIAGAAAKGYTVEVDAAGKAALKAGTEGTKAMVENKDALLAAAAGAKLLKEAYEKLDLQKTLSYQLTEKQLDQLEKENALVERRAELERKRLGVDKEGFSTGKDGNRIAAGGDLNTMTGIAAFLKSAGVEDDAKARNIAREFADSKGDVTFMNNPGQLKYGGAGSTISQALLKAAEQYTFGQGNSGTGQNPSTIPKPESSTTVNINLGGTTQSIKTDAAGARVLQDVLSQLSAAKLSAGM